MSVTFQPGREYRFSDAFREVALPDGSTVLDLSGSGGTDATDLTGTTPVSHGGTGRTSLTSGAIFIASGTSTVGMLGPTTAGKIVISAGAAPAYSAYTLPASFPKGSVPYASAAEQVSALLSPAAAAVLVHAGGTGVPSWSTSLARALLPSAIAYEDEANTFTLANRFNGVVGFNVAPDGTRGIDLQSSGLNGANSRGISSDAVFTSSVTGSGIALLGRVRTAAASFTMGAAYAVYAQNASRGAASAITTQYGLFIEALSGAGTNIAIQTGNNPCNFGGDATVSGVFTGSSTGSFTGILTLAGGAAVTGGSSGTGRIWKDAINGLSLRGVAGSTNCLNILNDTNQSVLAIVAGSQTAAFAGNLTAAGQIAVTGIAAFSTTGSFGGMLTLSGGCLISGGSVAAGRIVSDATDGLVISGVAGATNAVVMKNGINQAFLTVPVGTTNVVLAAGLTIGTALTHLGTTLGFYGHAVVARSAAYTQTYATATRTHANPTSSDLTGITSSTTGTALAEPGAAYSQATDQQNYRRIQDQYNALRADVLNLKQVVNTVIDDLQANGLFQ